MEKNKDKKANLEDEKVIVKVNNNYKGIIGIFIISLLMISLVCTTIFLINKVSRLNKELEKEKSLFVEKIEFKNVGKLVAQEAQVRVVKNYQDDRDFLKLFNFPFTKYVYIFSYDIEVSAYVDFTKITQDEDIEAKKIIINLPHSKLNNNSAIIQGSKIKWYDNKNLFNSVNPDQIDEFQKEMIKEAETQAINSGILKRADKQAQLLIRSMVKSNKSYQEFDVDFNYID